MLLKNKNKIIKWILWILVVIWMIVIFMLSNAPSTVSSKNSGNIIRGSFKATINVTNGVGITDYHPSKAELNKIVRKLNEPLRECMHGFEYFILAILLICALYKSNVKKIYILTIIICVTYSLSDEIHQIFIPGRAFELIDLFIDLIGCLIGCLLCKGVALIKHRNI